MRSEDDTSATTISQSHSAAALDKLKQQHTLSVL